MRTSNEDEIRTAIRQAWAIAGVGGQHSARETLVLAHRLYNAMLLLQPDDRARRIRLIDAMFVPRRAALYKHSP